VPGTGICRMPAWIGCRFSFPIPGQTGANHKRRLIQPLYRPVARHAQAWRLPAICAPIGVDYAQHILTGLTAAESLVDRAETADSPPVTRLLSGQLDHTFELRGERLGHPVRIYFLQAR